MRTAARVLFLLALIQGVYWLYLERHYVSTYPKAPQVAVGRTVPLNVHGTVIYLTEQEDLALTRLWVGLSICSVCGGLLWKHSS